MTQQIRRAGSLFGALLASSLVPGVGLASSHMDAPLITLDDPANTTDVYAFVSEQDGVRYLTTALAVYPFEEPGIGPNTYRFDDDVRYGIHVALDDAAAAGRPTFSYLFDFQTEFVQTGTTLQAFLGPIEDVFDDNQNLRQSYTVTLVDGAGETVLGQGTVPPNNQGLVTPFYNQGDDGDNPAKEGAASAADLDPYTEQSIADLELGHQAFAGQRDDGFYADIQSIFDLDFTFSGPNKPFDSQGGFNVHTIVLNIPLDQLDGATVAGVYATTERRQRTLIVSPETFEDERRDRTSGRFAQVGRQGNPLFNEGLVALEDKDLYNRISPTRDAALFAQYALQPELATVLGLPDTDRQDIAAIFIPDLIKVDLTTGPARLAGQDGFDRLGIFGGDTLVNGDGDEVPGGWPNGRRFGDDVLDIALIALGVDPDGGNLDADGVTENDISFNQVFPYAATPLNGRNHDHHGD